jgi:DNA polymerase III subunit delta
MDHSQQAEKPVVYIVHGDDSLAIKRFISGMLEKMGDPSIAEMNTTRLDGRQASEDEIRSSANAMPFLSERRLVILTNPTARLSSDKGRKSFTALLDGLPDSTALVLVVEDTIERGKWKTLHDSHLLRRWLEKAGKRGFYQACQLPALGAMPRWVQEEARRQKGQFLPEAAAALVAHIGNDTQMASLEINKLLLYVDGKHPVAAEDVEEMTAQGGEGDVFAMVDALAAGNARSALSHLQHLLEEQEPIYIFGMIVRQFRLLLQAREVIDEGKGQAMAQELHQSSFIADKLASQARRFNMDQLEAIYHRLLEMDEAMKSSQMPSDLVLDTFIAELAK